MLGYKYNRINSLVTFKVKSVGKRIYSSSSKDILVDICKFAIYCLLNYCDEFIRLVIGILVLYI